MTTYSETLFSVVNAAYAAAETEGLTDDQRAEIQSIAFELENTAVDVRRAEEEEVSANSEALLTIVRAADAAAKIRGLTVDQRLAIHRIALAINAQAVDAAHLTEKVARG